ncbi:hypothetical protein F5Y12DRAFT_391077 [Xylaria sp. FL1777]|nr:hypothetical protein F5Y12DRAFT_391077 [Xylaria sp. FL1777]
MPFGLLLDRANFFAEQGSQIEEEERILIDDVAEFEMRDVQRFSGYLIHNGYLKHGELNAGGGVVCGYGGLGGKLWDSLTATYILNHSLEKCLARTSTGKAF